MFSPTLPLNGRAGIREEQRSLLVALAVSLLFHWLTLVMLGRAAKPPGEGTPGRATLVEHAALSVRVIQHAQRVLPGDPVPLAAPEGDPALPDAQPLPPAPEEAVVAARLGHRRLAEYVPPYLAQTPVFEVPAGGWYLPRAQLSVQPRLLDEPALSFPDSVAGGAPRAGKIVLRIFIAAGGAVDRVEISQSSLPSEYAEVAAAAFAAVRFRPGELEGVPVNSEMRVEVVLDTMVSGGSHLTGVLRIPEAVEPAASSAPRVAPPAGAPAAVVRRAAGAGF
ncbi:hypothetical protein [Accumulibacter sp.]|uniref:hypothetical protein n=1 Tax=Accumulibacter sp. TaxID=2053492 RepID=UPI002619F5F2|nr:hypothetical protein [Accumulibacter sp.]